MKYVGTAAACGLLASSSLVQAEGGCINPFTCGTWSGNIGFASEYVWQGIAMSAGDPTINGGFDWDSGNHWYFSMWGSNVDYYDIDEAQYISSFLTNCKTQASAGGACVRTVITDDYSALELDFYIGYWGYIGGGYNTPYDIGIGYYMYPDARHDDVHYFASNNGDTKYLAEKKDGSFSPVEYVGWGTNAYIAPYVGIGHYFLDDRVKTFAYLSYTNDYNGQNQDEWEVYNDVEIYLPNAFTLRLHVGYTWGEYWQKNLFGYNTNADLAYASRTWAWCGYTYASDRGKYAKDSVTNTKRYYDCVGGSNPDGSGNDDDFFDWGIGLSRSFGQFDFTLDYVWVTGVENADQVKSWWSGMDQTGANEIYTNGKLVGAVKMAI